MNDHHAQIDEEPPKKKQVSNINKKADSNIKHLSILVRTDSMTFTCCDKLEAKTPKPQPNGMERSNSQVLDLSCSSIKPKNNLRRWQQVGHSSFW
jgi:hypothetical protein